MSKYNALLAEIAEQVPKMVRSFDSKDWVAFREALEKIYAVADSDAPLEHVWDLLFGDCGRGGLVDEAGCYIWEACRIFLQVKGQWEAFIAEDEAFLLAEANSNGQMSLPLSPCEPQEPGKCFAEYLEEYLDECLRENLGPPDTPLPR